MKGRPVKDDVFVFDCCRVHGFQEQGLVFWSIVEMLERRALFGHDDDDDDDSKVHGEIGRCTELWAEERNGESFLN